MRTGRERPRESGITLAKIGKGRAASENQAVKACVLLIPEKSANLPAATLTGRNAEFNCPRIGSPHWAAETKNPGN
jgi:hypothetical protein